MPKAREKIVKIARFSCLVLQCVDESVEGQLKFCTSFLVYSQIWLNLPMDDCHFFCIFLWMIVTLATNKNSLKKHRDSIYTKETTYVVGGLHEWTRV